MANYVKVAAKNELQTGKMKEIQVNGKPIAIANVDDEYLAFDGHCTHAQCSLSGGFLDGYTLTCYCHGGQFDISTGEVLAPPPESSLKTYKVKVEGEDILVEI